MTIEEAVLNGKAAVVTGGSRGIGRAIVERLARDGAEVVFGYARNAEAAAEVERTVAEAGGTAHAVAADLGEPDGVARLFEQAEKHLDGLDILVNNAADHFLPALMVDVTEEYYDRMMAVNAKAPFLALQYAARNMRDGGRVINVSTLNTVLPGPGISVYAGSKGALEQFTAVAAHELGSRFITVNTVSPGATDTDLIHQTNSPEGLEMFKRLSPLRRIGQPSDVADVVAFLAGPDGRWMTGQNLRACGGIR
ncbi:SDR family oxidoreductase [Rugosimonospora africana]|uniref:3-oxoacyl-ACP reductase n=1 Tax=Rugosimonospora africana TaxID=556532 RepID=A0A8J3QY34_9ACTN|nr:SDR family oxidoreductase [Rugosimonospora africana]GIH18646.1 3-oxoacyl-ACP reductase [Rugosimonospora africana]